MTNNLKNEGEISLESPENEINLLREEWEQSLKKVLEMTFMALNKVLPENINPEAIPRLLEEATKERITAKKETARFIVISAPAGGGKTTVGKIVEEFGLKRLPRVTSREKRPSETEGRDYFFISPKEFEEQKIGGEFLYYKETYGSGRAISKKLFDEALASNQKFYAEGDALAYHEIIKNNPEYQNIQYQSLFLIPPSFSELLKRIETVRTKEGISEKEFKERLKQSIHYLEESGKHIANNTYDGFLVNDDLERVRSKIKEYSL